MSLTAAERAIIAEIVTCEADYVGCPPLKDYEYWNLVAWGLKQFMRAEIAQ